MSLGRRKIDAFHASRTTLPVFAPIRRNKEQLSFMPGLPKGKEKLKQVSIIPPPPSASSPMTEPRPAFTPEPPDPRLEALDDEIADLIAEALFDHLLKHDLVPSPIEPEEPRQDETH